MFNNISDAPDIARCLRTGYPQGEPSYPHCPICGAECDTYYMNKYDEIFACEECLKTASAWDIEA